MKPEGYDFCGWVTKAGVRCSDGRIIHKDAFKDCDGKRAPLVWNHLHDTPINVLGHVILEHRDRGIYGYGFFNETEAAATAKSIVTHGDIEAMSICANHVKEDRRSGEVFHGNIVEVSLVHSGANPGAYIEDIIAHSDEEDGTMIVCTGASFEIEHADSEESAKSSKEESSKEEDDDSEETVEDIFNSLTSKQKDVVYALVGAALEDSLDHSDDLDDEETEDEGGSTMKQNAFDKSRQMTGGDNEEHVFTHAEVAQIVNGMKQYGTLRESFIQHAGTYGIDNIEWLFPEERFATPQSAPGFIKRDTGWVQKIMSGVHHTPFSRIKSLFADITEDEARARGYIKGKLKKEEVFGLLKRTTTPTTVYKKQKLDRDDIIDITDFDVVAWLKAEMRMMLDEELARAYLIGDGRLASSDDKINEQNIRPIAKEEELYAIQVTLNQGTTEDDTARAFIRAAIKARKDYKGSGQPTLYTTEDMLTDMLLLTDNNGRDLYTDEAALARKLRVKEIVTIPIMEDATGKDDLPLIGIIVNLQDYNVGADKGGAINMFDDFDIDYNQQKYLIETRCSGALIVPKSAIVFQMKTAGSSTTPPSGSGGEGAD